MGMGMFEAGSSAHAQAFHRKGPENEIKLFVGGLAFKTQEHDMKTYFQQFGIVVDTIVMRERATKRGRGFGFVKMQFKDRQDAEVNKIKLLKINQDSQQGHYINEKRVDVKSADDYVKPANPEQKAQFNNPAGPNPMINDQGMLQTGDKAFD